MNHMIQKIHVKNELYVNNELWVKQIRCEHIACKIESHEK